MPEPVYTLSTKAELGDHDENISYEQSIEHLEKNFREKVKNMQITAEHDDCSLYKMRGLRCRKGLLSRMKFEFGLMKAADLFWR